MPLSLPGSPGTEHSPHFPRIKKRRGGDRRPRSGPQTQGSNVNGHPVLIPDPRGHNDDNGVRQRRTALTNTGPRCPARFRHRVPGTAGREGRQMSQIGGSADGFRGAPGKRSRAGRSKEGARRKHCIGGLPASLPLARCGSHAGRGTNQESGTCHVRGGRSIPGPLRCRRGRRAVGLETASWRVRGITFP